MSDKDFDFHRPAERREPSRFEPPPWEKEAFEELERRKSSEQAVEQVADAAAELTRPEEPEPLAAKVPQVFGEERAEEESPPAPVEGAALPGGRPASEEQAQPEQASPGGPALTESRMLELMAQLTAEEPSAVKGFWRLIVVAALVLGAIGMVLIVWSVAAFVRAPQGGSVAVFGGVTLLIFGAGFIGGALYMVVKMLRQRGVL